MHIMIDFDSNEILSNLVIQKIRSGKDKLSIFVDLCERLELDVPSLEMLQIWINLFEVADCSLGKRVETNYFDLLTFVFNKFRLFTHGIHHKSYIISFTLAHLNPRYGFRLPYEDCAFFTVLDCFTGEERNLRCTNENFFDYDLFLNSNGSFFAFISSNQLLFFNKSQNRNDIFNIHLLELNVEQKTFVCVDQKSVELDRAKIVFDQTDQTRFFLDGMLPNNAEPFIFIGQIVEDQILVSENPIQMPVVLECERLVGNVVSGIIHGYNSTTMRRVYQYREYALNDNGNGFDLLTQLEFEASDDSEPTKRVFHVSGYAWHHDTCFIAVSQTYKRAKKIYTFDVKTRRFSYSNIASFTRLYDLRVNNDDDSLIIMTTSEIYRYDLRPPKLETLCWFKWRRRQILSGNKTSIRLPTFSQFFPFYGLT